VSSVSGERSGVGKGGLVEGEVLERSGVGRRCSGRSGSEW
jgi:hypothetical protein